MWTSIGQYRLSPRAQDFLGRRAAGDQRRSRGFALSEKGVPQTMVAHRLSRRALLEMAAAAGLARGASPVRLLVVTGGHEFDAVFWALFKDRPEWKMEARAHDPADTCTVYDRPIAPDFDPVLLYDMPPTITAVQQQNFLALFQRGAG